MVKKKSKFEKLGGSVARKFKKIKKTKPTAKIKGINPEKFITKGLGKPVLVREGKTGYFNEEYVGETKWLG